ncbi:hypothetical protein ACI65C_005088 [Semiaphis heraclei]
MLERFVELETSIRGTLGLLDNAPKGLTSDEWRLTTAIVPSSGSGLSEEQSIPNDSTEPKTHFSIWSTVDTKVAQQKPVGTNTSRAIIEVQRYLEDSLQQTNADPLKWWQENNHNYPYLSQLARKTLLLIDSSL